MHIRTNLRRTAAAVFGLLIFSALPGIAAPETPSPFANLPGRWVGEGRLGIKDNKAEKVKCRVTYFLSDQADQIRQTIRCASASGNIEVLSTISHASGNLTGSWSETVHNMRGELTGQVTPTGFRVVVSGADLTANMDIMVKGSRQIVEIQFHNSTLVGLTLMLAKG